MIIAVAILHNSLTHLMEQIAGPYELGREDSKSDRDDYDGRTGQYYHYDTDEKDRNANYCHDQPLQFFDGPIIHIQFELPGMPRR